MNWVNYDDAIGQIEEAGFKQPSAGWQATIDSGRKQGVRCKVDGARQGGWVALHTLRLDDGRDALIGAYCSYRGAEADLRRIELRVDAKPVKLSPDLRAAIKAQHEAARKREEADLARRQEEAHHTATRWWRQLADAGESGYMAKKGFAASELFGARVSQAGNLVIPVQDTAGKIYGLQVIYPIKDAGPRKDRDKDFTPPGLAKKAHFFQLGIVQRGGVVLLCEGFATGASLRKATNLPVVVAFDAGNLVPVALAIHKAHRKDVKILVCADDDYGTMAKTGRNPGIDAAKMAALAVDGAVVWPEFPDERPADRKGPTDFNDLHVHPGGGLQAVRTQIEAALATAGWRSPKRAGAEIASSGGQGAGGCGGSNGRRGALSIMPLDDLVERFIPLDDGTGKYVFDTWTNKIAQREQMTALLPAGVRGDDIKRHPVWIERGAHYLDQVGFDPSGKDPAVALNTWRGWPVAAREGSCQRLLELLEYLCSGEENSREIYCWLLRWIGYPLQRPGAKMNSAVIMHGPQGTGKSTVFQALARIYGDYSTVLNQRGLEDKFNADWIDSKLFILAEEVVTRAEMWHIKNELKELITGEWVRVNPKNVSAYRQRNQINIVYLSNEDQPLPLDNDDRRHLVVWTPPTLSEEYYDDVFLELESGGIEAFYHYLLHLDLGDFHPKKRPPMTSAKRKLILRSMPSEARFIEELLAEETCWPICPAQRDDFYAAYNAWCKANGERNPRSSNQFIGYVDRLPGWEVKKCRVHDNYHNHGPTVPKRIVIPPPEILQRAGREKKPDETAPHWLTACIMDFKNSGKEPDAWKAAV